MRDEQHCQPSHASSGDFLRAKSSAMAQAVTRHTLESSAMTQTVAPHRLQSHGLAPTVIRGRDGLTRTYDSLD